ncbi:hypothetical protein [uncultured Aurantimicrobium sp.]|uniref:hypothetical protein n=1 Tax=uncultured Aurantimicrobium sp. TaxID=1705357 RepID=UPI002614FEA7|nr:hypothetical protein [uncultured Aurantimicrobium sp.]
MIVIHKLPVHTVLITTAIALPSFVLGSSVAIVASSAFNSPVILETVAPPHSEHADGKLTVIKPTEVPVVEVVVDEPIRPQPPTPPGVEAFVADAPNNISIYTPPADFVYNGTRMVNVSSADIPSWISFDVNNDNEQSGEDEVSWNSSLYAFYNNKFGQTYQYDPIEVHAHWWGDPATSPDHDSIVNYIDNRDALTVNFVVSANRVTSMMPLSWMATTTGYRNPWAWKMEIDPRLSDDIYKTVGALMYVVELKNGQLQNEPIRLHKEFYPTGCSEIDVVYLRSWVNKFASGEYDINTGEPSVEAPSPSPSPSP